MLKGLLDKFKKRSSGSNQEAATDAQDLNADDGKSKHSFSPDAPISSQAEDRFQRWPFAERVAHTLAVRPDPSSLVVGIYGPWGDGKTSTMRMMEEALKRYPKVAVTAFNPWQFDSESLLLKGFFDSLAQTLGRSLPTKKEEIGAALAKYGFLLAPVGGGEVAKGVGGILSTVDLDELRQRVERFLDQAGLRVVVMIDDIDRLDRREIQAILRLVKLTAGFQHVSYVLAFDDEVVAAALGERYGEGNAEAGRRFLEKIVQVPLHLPPAESTELRKVAFEGVDQALAQSGITLTEDQVNAFVRHFVDGLEFELTTPRKAKLYSNALLFALPLLKSESNVVDLMLIEGIRIYYPRLYRTIRENPELFLPRASSLGRRDDARRKQLDSLIDEALAGHPAEQKEKVRSRLLEVLFPRLSSMGYGSEWDEIWSREQRICSSDYFPRYFTYAVPRQDVSDLAVSEFLDVVKGDVEKAVEKLRTYSQNGAMQQLVRKLRRRAEGMPPETSMPLAAILSRHGDLVPREKEPILSDWTYTQAAILVAELLRNVADAKERTAKTKELMAAAPLPFAFECLRWIRVDDPKSEPKRIVSKDVEDELGRLLATRVEAEATKSPLYRTFGADTPRLLWVWHKFGDPRKVSDHLKQSFEKGKDEIVAFLASYIGLAWGLESGLPHKADLRRDTYDAIAKLIAPAVVMDNLRALYGSALDGAQYLHGSDVPFERRIALQFAHIHQQVTNPGAQDGSAPAQRSTGTDGAMPLVACLGWGSLVWNPGDLPREGDWRTDGPMLPIEFARQSTKGASAGALTLVLVPGYESQAQSLWVPLRVKDAAAGREALGKRERIPEEDWGTAIAVWEAPDSNAPIAGLADWARARGIGAVVWTALPPRFEGKSNRVPTADEAVAYLRQLSGEQKKNAEQYVRKAPGQIDTPYRRRFVTEFDWTANGK